MKKLKVMMMTLMMCLVSVSAWGQENSIKHINIDKSNIITTTTTISDDNINIDSIYSKDGTIYILQNNGNIYDIKNTDKICNLQGIDVTKLNGSLISGVYIVVINKKYVCKILVR